MSPRGTKRGVPGYWRVGSGGGPGPAVGFGGGGCGVCGGGGWRQRKGKGVTVVGGERRAASRHVTPRHAASRTKGREAVSGNAEHLQGPGARALAGLGEQGCPPPRSPAPWGAHPIAGTPSTTPIYQLCPPPNPGAWWEDSKPPNKPQKYHPAGAGRQGSSNAAPTLGAPCLSFPSCHPWVEALGGGGMCCTPGMDLWGQKVNRGPAGTQPRDGGALGMGVWRS